MSEAIELPHLNLAPITIPLTACQLRFTVCAETDIHFSAYKGSALRGALAGVLQRQYCPEWRNERTDALHRQLCPICQLLGWEQEDIEGGDLRRPYVLTPPLDQRTLYEVGECFCFGLTLFGARQALLPYLVLGITAMGNHGVGQPDRTGQRGRFRLVELDAINPLSGESRALLHEGGMVRLDTLSITHADVVNEATRLGEALTLSAAASSAPLSSSALTLSFHTPLRLNQDRQLVKTPHFFPLMKQVVLRLLDLAVQHGEGRPTVTLAQDIYPYADQVQLVADQTRWWELAGYSHRLGREQQLSGIIGTASYRALDWKPLLPWLVWGQITQVGKNTVKGCGVYTVAAV
jgi:hypothetical protein